MRVQAFVVVTVVLFGAASLQAKWFGERDVRDDPESFLNEEEWQLYSGVGQVECPVAKVKIDDVTGEELNDRITGRPIFVEDSIASTAFHVGSFSLLVTNSHAFAEDYWDEYSRTVRQRLVDPKLCVVVFYEYPTGKELEIIPIKEALIRWEVSTSFGDRSDDIALIKLTSESRFPSQFLPYRTGFGKGERAVNGQAINIVGFHGDLQKPKVKRKNSGFIWSARSGFNGELFAAQSGLPFKRLDRVVVGNYPASYGTSGSPIITSYGVVIGIHQGHADRKYQSGFSDRQFSPQNNYNLGILFDEQFDHDVQRMK